MKLNELLSYLTGLARDEQIDILPNEGEELDLVFERLAGDDPNVKFPLDNESIETLKKQYALIQTY